VLLEKGDDMEIMLLKAKHYTEISEENPSPQQISFNIKMLDDSTLWGSPAKSNLSG
jgi:hypothetical protein